MRRLLTLTILAGLSACTAERVWIPPPGVSDAQLELDHYECEKDPAGVLLGTTGVNAGDSRAAMQKKLAEQGGSESLLDRCMRAKGYRLLEKSVK